jgi:7-carboxy-7-deazaguanine synthase
VLLETSGALCIAPVDPRVHVILDIKTPGSGEVEANLWSNLDRLKPTDELKFVVCDRADFDWAVAQVKGRQLLGHCPVHFSAAFGAVNPTDLAAWILETRLPIRLQLQQHKILWDPAARGV